jgi:acetyltransferase-like isoleucine patch superfamily enzyme/acyl carrier protein
MIARLLDLLALRGCDRVGPGLQRVGRPRISNLGRLELGRGVSLVCTPVPLELVTGPRGVLRIGDSAHLGFGTSIAAHSEIELGPGVQLGAFCNVIDTDFHTAGDPRAPAAAAPVHLGRDVRLGARVTVLRGTRLGAGARVLAGSVVQGEVPAGAVVGGVPARPLEPARGGGAVREVVQRTFGMAHPPEASAGLDELPGWTSLGALNLLLALEQACAISLRPEQLMAVRSVGELERLVASAG